MAFADVRDVGTGRPMKQDAVSDAAPAFGILPGDWKHRSAGSVLEDCVLVVAVDPGYRQSAFVVYDGTRVCGHGIRENSVLLGDLGIASNNVMLVLEEMQLFASNHGVGREIFDSVFWSGRFAQVWTPRPFDRILRSTVRAHLQATKGGDAAVRQSLIDRFGPYKEVAIGRKASPGPLYGIHADEWSALAIAVTWWDLQGCRNGREARTT